MYQDVNIIVYIWSPNLAICTIVKIGGCTRLLAWDQEMAPWKQMETMIIPTSLRSKTLLFIRKIKDAPLNCMIRI